MTAGAPQIRVLLADDHAVMRAGFRMILEAAGDIDVVGEAANGREAVTLASALGPDVICMDVQMPDMDGLEATARIVADPAVTSAVVIVTTFDRDDYLFQALSAGASGFLLKNAGPEELVNAVRVAAAGDALLAPAVTRRVIERFATPGGGRAFAPTTAHPADPTQDAAGLAAGRPIASGHAGADTVVSTHPTISVELTERETEVLRLLAQALSNGEIAQRLFIGEATVKTHLLRVFAKLGVDDRTRAVMVAVERGLLPRPGG
jgi:DNA-binding NarL/FixJ family response regulator